MEARIENVSETFVIVTLTVEEARAATDALSYFNTSVGGNNFEMGYSGKDPDTLRAHKAARRLQFMLMKMTDKADKGQ